LRVCLSIQPNKREQAVNLHKDIVKK